MTIHDLGFLGPEAHGSAPSFRAGCRCVPCRSVVVDASAARAHLLTLQGKGVGYRHAARLSGISRRIVNEIRSGRRQRIAISTEQAITGITRPTLARGARVNAYEARKKLRTLLAEGFTLEDLARVLHLHGKTIKRDTLVVPLHEQGKREPKMRVSSVIRVRTFFARVMAEGPDSSIET